MTNGARYVLLDRGGDAPLRNHYRLITTEVDFLRCAPDEPRLFVRGKALCDWARAYFDSRDIPYEELTSPSKELLEIIPGLTLEWAKELSIHLGSKLDQLPRPLNVNNVLQALFPTRMWSESPSIAHAAAWLLWLLNAPEEAFLRPLISWRADAWRLEAKGAEQDLYCAKDRHSALAIIDRWLGITDEKPVPQWGVFPLPLPVTILDRARETWRVRIIETQGRYFEEILSRLVPTDLLEIAAIEAAEFYRHNRGGLSWETCEKLSPYLHWTQLEALFEHVQPPIPENPPEHPADVLVWFRNVYLPYRAWQHTRKLEDAHQTVQKVAWAFSLWYLDQYPSGILGSPLQKELSYHKVARLKKLLTSDVTLVVVLDGLNLSDAQRLQLLIKNNVPRLSLLADGLAFAPLPTVTEFCKPALFSGDIPANAGDHSVGQVLPENQTPIELLRKAESGQVYLWRIMEPDHTYHTKNSYATLQAEIQSQLQGVANKIQQLVEAVPAQIRLRIVITTDHGRLMQVAKRSIPIPKGYKAQGRAAWGKGSKTFPSSGYFIDGELAHLYGQSFGLPEDAVVPLDDRVFLTKDGKGGKENFPHGGIYPEEVIIPWMEWARDVKEPPIQVFIQGEAETNKQGMLEFDIVNSSDIELRLTELILIFGLQEQNVLSLDISIGAYSARKYSTALSPWPNARKAARASGRVKIVQPSGLTFERPVELKLQSKEMYSHEGLDELLEGLDL